MPAPVPAPPLRYVSKRRPISPVLAAASETTRSNAAAATTSGTAGDGVNGPVNTVLPSTVPFGAAARVHYANTLSSSEVHAERARDARVAGGEGGEEEEEAAMEYLRATRRGSAPSPCPSPLSVSGGGVASAGGLPTPPPQAPPSGSLSLYATHGGAGGSVAAAAAMASTV